MERYYTSDIHTKMAGAPANLALHVDEAERGRDGHLGGAGAGGMETSQSMHSVCSTTSPTSSNLQPLTPEGMDCYGNERQMLKEQAKFYNNPLLSDVTLKLGTSLYHAHKLILVRASEVFERMFSTEWANPDVKEVELVEEPECLDIFPKFLKFLYDCHIVLSTDNTLPVLVLADKYNVEDLRHVCITFACTNIIPKLQLKDVFHIWFQYATKCYHQKLIQACVSALSEKMDDITFSAEWEQEWVNLDKEQLMEFLKSSDLTIKDEYELWWAVVKWLQSANHPARMCNIETHLKEILQYIRFPMMTADQLCEVEKSKLVEQFPHLFSPFLMQAYKYHSLSLASRSTMKDFLGHLYLLRNYTDLRWDKRIVVPNYTACQKWSEVGARFSTRASSFPAHTWEWELKVYPKGFSATSDDFRCILYSNLILDQPRPVEFALSVVDNKRILCTVTGKKNFSKNRYTADTEIDKKISVSDLSLENCPYLSNDTLTMQIVLKPVE